MPISKKCSLCGKPAKTHRKANFGKSKSGKSGLKPLVDRKEFVTSRMLPS